MKKQNDSKLPHLDRIQYGRRDSTVYRKQQKREALKYFGFVALLIVSAVPILIYKDRLPIWMLVILGFWPLIGSALYLVYDKLLKSREGDL
jgi:hypothetical protein